MSIDKTARGYAETIIADLRRTHAQLKQGRTAPDVKTWSMRLTLEEVDVLLALHDEVIELRKQVVGDLETPFAPVRSRFVESLVAQLEPVEDVVDRIATSCPRRGTIHDCPLGGCATGREARETPPDLPRSCSCWRLVNGEHVKGCDFYDGHPA